MHPNTNVISRTPGYSLSTQATLEEEQKPSLTYMFYNAYSKLMSCVVASLLKL